MSDFQPASAPPPPEGYGGHQPARGPRPASIKTSINLVWALVALSVIGTLTSLIYLDDLVDAALEQAGTGGGAITESTARATVLVTTVIGVIIGVLLYALLAYFLGKGKNWARIVITVFGGLGVVFGLISLATSAGTQPVLFTIVAVLQLVLLAALLFFLWKKESSQWLTGKP